ncbi:MAG: hypothetical protein Q7U47_09900 [Paludibacter sp.]|nr:hypothetical protein [Paludibacter sp.]
MINRELKSNCEIFFYNEGLRSPEVRKAIQEVYVEKAPFPILK